MLRVLSLILNAKKNLFYPKKKDFLIIDKLTGFKLIRLIKNKKINILDIRFNEIFILILVLAFLKKIIHPTLKLTQHYILIYIKIANPKVILTANDVDTFFWDLKKYFPQKKIIIFQNNYRNGWDFGNVFKNKLRTKGKCDLFITYCNAVKSEYKKKIKCEYFSAGSIENNLIAKNFRNKKEKLIYISQFKNWDNGESTLGENNKIINLKESYIKSDQIILNFLNNYCIKNNKRLLIFLRNTKSDLVKKEINYYNLILNFKVKFLKKQNITHGYKLISQFDYFVTIDSTMGYECLARGKRVAFFNNRYLVSNFKNGKKHRFGWPKNYKINGPFWTNSTDKKEMEKVLKNLFLMSSTKWSIIKKKYINDVISYDFKNRRLIKKLNRIFEI